MRSAGSLRDPLDDLEPFGRKPPLTTEAKHVDASTRPDRRQEQVEWGGRGGSRRLVGPDREWTKMGIHLRTAWKVYDELHERYSSIEFAYAY